ncbi:MAG: aminotransferase class V-fold PLP-dependent enzyme [bacterium]
MKKSRTKRGICGICPAGCWIKAHCDEKDRIVKLEPDDDPVMGITCKLAEEVQDIVYSPDRVLHPLKRKGPKGNYDFESISWEEAFSEITDNLTRIKEESGPEAAAVYTGVGSFEQAFCDIYQPADVRTSSASSVLFPFGSPNTMGVGALCYVSYGVIAPHLTTGRMLIDMYNDVDESELIVVWGANPATDLPPVDMKRIMEARGRGAEVIVIDPRRTATARLTGAHWTPIRPGTDGALALGLCNVLIEEELYDRDFAEHWTLGFDEFSRYVQHFRPEVVEHITGVPADTVVWLARRLAAARGASQYMYTGLEYSNSGAQAIRATLTLWALAGQLDVPGGRCFIMDRNKFPVNREGLVKSPPGARRLGEDRFPLYVRYREEAHAIELPRAVLEGKPYPVRFLMVLGGSMLTSWPNPELWRKTFQKLDFMVCIDRQLTADSAYADMVLPATTYFEMDSYMTYGPLFRLREKMIEPLGEARSDLAIMAELADRLGYGHLYPQTTDELYDYILQGSGFTIDEVREAGGAVSTDTEIMQYRKWEKGLLRKDGKPGFDTPSGKFEIYSTVLEEFGYDPLPVYTEPVEGPLSRPDLFEKFPLVFNSGARVRTSFHTQHHNVPGLVREKPEPTVTMSSKDAGARGIEDGSMARITTPRGSLTMRVEVSDDMTPGSVDLNHACGSPVGPEAWSSRNVNELTDLMNYDPVSGFPVYKCLLCEVEKAEGERIEVRSCELTADELDWPDAEVKGEEIYLDHNATTWLSEEVKQEISSFLCEYGNPSSIHQAGARVKKKTDEARRKVAAALHCTPRRIVFTGSGSEANNLAIKGAAFQRWHDKPHFITTAIEHPSTLKAMQWLADMGFGLTVLEPEPNGIVDAEKFEKAISENPVLASVMLANNETGAIQPVEDMARIARERGVLFHCDAVQGFGKIPLDVERLGVDMLSISAHKIYGPKGMGALYVRKGIELTPLISGGGQEGGLRAGTENTLGMVALGKAAEEAESLLGRMEQVRKLRDRMEEGILDIIPGSFVNGDREARLPNTINITLPGYRGESVVTALSRKGIYLSSGSACKAGSSSPSAALLAMGLSEEQAHCSVRISLGAATTPEHADRFLEELGRVTTETKNVVHFAPCR